MTNIRLGFFVGKGGGDYFALEKARASGLIDYDLSYVCTSSKLSRVVESLKSEGRQEFYVAESMKNRREEFFRESLARLQAHNTDWIFTSGFLFLLPDFLVEQFRNRIINSHQSLLPAYQGIHTKEDMASTGDKFLGATIHFVDTTMDMGPKLFQAVFPNYGMADFSRVLRHYRFVQDALIVQQVRNLARNQVGQGMTVFNETMIIPAVDEDILNYFYAEHYG